MGTGSYTVGGTYDGVKGRMRLMYTDKNGTKQYIQPFANGNTTTTIEIKGGTALVMQMVGGSSSDGYPNNLKFRIGSQEINQSWYGAKYYELSYTPIGNCTLTGDGADLTSVSGAIGWYLRVS